MRFVLRLAFRNAFRNRRRSSLTLVAIFLGVGIFLLAQSLVAGIERTMIGTEVDAEQSHLRVMTRAFQADETFFPLDTDFSTAPQVEGALRARYPDARITQRTAFLARVGDGRRTLTCRGLVVDAAEYRSIFNVGELPLAEDAPFQLWLGGDLAAAFDARAGDVLSLQAKTHHGAQNALTDVRVAGVVSTGHPLVDGYTVFVPLHTGRELLSTDDAFATEVLARFANPDEADEAAALIEGQWPSLQAQTWREKTQYIVELNRVRRTVFNIFTFVILLMAAVGVANTTLMSGFERVREIGTLLALGMSRQRVMGLFILEALVVGLLGTLLGVAAGGAPSYYYERHGIPFPVGEDTAGMSVPVPPLLYLDLTPNALLLATGLGVVVAVAAAVYPAWKVSGVQPVEALQVEG